MLGFGLFGMTLYGWGLGWLVVSRLLWLRFSGALVMLRIVGLYVLVFERCFGVCYFAFTLIVLVRLVLLPLM